MDASTRYAVDRLRRVHALTAFKEGLRVQKSIPGLKRQVLKMLVLNYTIFLLVSLILNGLFYFYILDPLIVWLFGSEGGFFASLGQWLFWMIQLTVAAVFAFISLRFSLELASIWHQQLVSQVIRHYREIPEVSYSLREWFSSIASTSFGAFKLCLFPIILLFAGLIPVIGLMLVYIFESHLLGRDTLSVYLEEIQSGEEKEELNKKLRWISIKLGWLPMLMAFIPVVGWLMLPMVVVVIVIGLTSLIERARQ